MEFRGHIPCLRCLGLGLHLRRKRSRSASARFTKDSPPNGRPVRVWSRSCAISPGSEERNAFQSSISVSEPRLCTRGSFSTSPIAACASPLVVPRLSHQTSTNRVPQDVANCGRRVNGPALPRRPYPGRLTAPSCIMRPSWSMTCQCSTHLPPATRMMSMTSHSILLPVDGMPMKSPWWVPCRVL